MNALVCIESCEKMQFDVGLQQENTLVLSSVGLQKNGKIGSLICEVLRKESRFTLFKIAQIGGKIKILVVV